MQYKFRAWVKDEKKMIYPNERNYYVRNDGRLFRIVKLSDKKGQNFLSIETDSELMQFTGLLDKNGKEIYFSDIIKYKDESGKKQIGIVKDYDYFVGYIEAIGGDDEGNQDLELHPDYSQDCEVIGDIYSNPELLK